MHPQERHIEQALKLHALIREIVGEVCDEREILSQSNEIYYSGHSQLSSTPESSNKTVDPTELHHAGSKENQSANNSTDILPLYWLLSPGKIDDLLLVLEKIGKLNCDPEVFKIIFLNLAIPAAKIKWLGFNNEFACLMGDLITYSIVGKIPKQWNFLCMCFCKEDGNNFDPRILSSQYSQNDVNANFAGFVKRLIEKLKANEHSK